MPPPASLFSMTPLDGGLLTLSRFPIVDSDFLVFKRGVFSDWLSRKGVLYSKIDI